MKYWYIENNDIDKEAEDDTNHWKIFCIMNWKKINIVKTSTLPKATYKFNAMFMKIPMAFFINKKNPKIHVELQRSQRVKAILRKKSKTRGTMFLDFKLYWKAIVIKIVWCCHKNRHISMEQNWKSRNKWMPGWSNNIW